MAESRKPLELAAVRVPVMTVTVLGQAIGLLFTLGDRRFLLVLAFSGICAAINAAPLWIDRIQVKDFEPLWVALAAYVVVPGSDAWTRGRTWANIFYVLLAAFVLVAAIGVLIAQRRLSRVERAEAHSALNAYRGTIFCAVIALTTLEQAIDFLHSQDLSLAWSIPAALPIAWYAWMYALYRMELRKLNPTGNLSIVNRND